MGSEMCIRDSFRPAPEDGLPRMQGMNEGDLHPLQEGGDEPLLMPFELGSLTDNRGHTRRGQMRNHRSLSLIHI